MVLPETRRPGPEQHGKGWAGRKKKAEDANGSLMGTERQWLRDFGIAGKCDRLASCRHRFNEFRPAAGLE